MPVPDANGDPIEATTPADAARSVMDSGDGRSRPNLVPPKPLPPLLGATAPAAAADAGLLGLPPTLSATSRRSRLGLSPADAVGLAAVMPAPPPPSAPRPHRGPPASGLAGELGAAGSTWETCRPTTDPDRTGSCPLVQCAPDSWAGAAGLDGPLAPDARIAGAAIGARVGLRGMGAEADAFGVGVAALAAAEGEETAAASTGLSLNPAPTLRSLALPFTAAANAAAPLPLPLLTKEAEPPTAAAASRQLSLRSCCAAEPLALRRKCPCSCPPSCPCCPRCCRGL